jgi:predicted ATP-dependent serine protease
MKEAAKLGFKRCIVPRTPGRQLEKAPEGLEIIGCRSLSQVLDVALIS